MNKPIKDRLREALAMRNMTAADLARASGLNKGNVWRYVRGDVIPKQNAIAQMSNALGVSPAWLLGFDLNPDGTPVVRIDFDKLTDKNRDLLIAYYKALLDSQEAQGGNPEI